MQQSRSFIAAVFLMVVSIFLAFSNDTSSSSPFLLLFVHADLSSSHSVKQPLTIPKNYSKLLLEKSSERFHNDLRRINNLPISSLTTPCWEVSRDSTFTKSWTYADWERHQAQSALRYARHVGTWVVSTTAQNIIPTIMVVAAWTVLLFKATYRFSFNMSAAKFAMTLGFIQAPILLLLTLKTNRSLDRMLETRKAWGTLSRASRSLTGLVGTHVLEDDPESALLIARYLALVGWSLKASFRKNDDDTDMICALFQDFPQEREWLLKCPTKRPIGIVTRIRYLLSVLGRDRSHGGISIPPIIMLRMEEALQEIETTIGVCSRVFLSPVPPTYTRHTSRVLGKCFYDIYKHLAILILTLMSLRSFWW